MPAPTNAAFSVTGSPVTTSGTLAVGANGTSDQYIDGTGALRTLPSTGGGGGQVFYFNGNVSQGSIGGNPYYELGTTANTGPAADFTRATTGVIARFITDVGSPNHLVIPAGVWTIDVYLSETGGGSNHAQILAKLYTYNGSTFTLVATSTMEEITNGNVPDLYSFTISVPTTATLATDRIHIEFDIQNTNGKTVTLYTEDGRIGEVHSTYAIGLSSLNGLTESTQNFAVGTAGTDFAIVSASATHTFNLPTASAANRGALSSADWSTFNGKAGLASPAFTGTPTAPTATAGTNNTQIATTAYVDSATNNTLSAYSMRANNTAVSAIASNFTFKDLGEQTLPVTPSWGGTAPTGGTLRYRWFQIGNVVHFHFIFTYTGAGTGNTNLNFDHPSDMPIPVIFSGITATITFLYRYLSYTATTTNANPPSGWYGGLKRLTISPSTTYGWQFSGASTGATSWSVSGTYYA
jgi:hypothetical protein